MIDYYIVLALVYTTFQLHSALVIDSVYISNKKSSSSELPDWPSRIFHMFSQGDFVWFSFHFSMWARARLEDNIHTILDEGILYYILIFKDPCFLRLLQLAKGRKLHSPHFPPDKYHLHSLKFGRQCAAEILAQKPPQARKAQKLQWLFESSMDLHYFCRSPGWHWTDKKNTQQSCCVRFLQVETSGKICKETFLFCCHAKSHVSVGYGAKGHGLCFFLLVFLTCRNMMSIHPMIPKYSKRCQCPQLEF